jgi:hypothetical protein
MLYAVVIFFVLAVLVAPLILVWLIELVREEFRRPAPPESPRRMARRTRDIKNPY